MKHDGWVHNQKPVSKRIFTPKGPIFVSGRNDLFGAFDLMVLLDRRRTKYIQATLHTGIGEKKKQIDKLPWHPLYSSYEIWQKIPRKGVRILVKIDIPDLWVDRGLYKLFKDETEAEALFPEYVGDDRCRETREERLPYGSRTYLGDPCRG
ncbi:MAG: hypothetical protein MZV70_36280 [Desulfobacterales bacterium]|nr:hypothetical protein [Desulfobacterales bacterium]